MSALTKEKRNHIILVVIGTLSIVFLLWFFVIDAQLLKLSEISEKIDAAKQKQAQIQKAVDNAAQIEQDLNTKATDLSRLENGMASGDLYLWQINMIRNFKGDRPVDIPELMAGQVEECTMLPKFPYRQVSLIVSGEAFYHDFGRFLADFENTHPYMRVVNLQVFPTPTQLAANKEKVAFKMEIVTLTKPGPS